MGKSRRDRHKRNSKKRKEEENKMKENTRKYVRVTVKIGDSFTFTCNTENVKKLKSEMADKYHVKENRISVLSQDNKTLPDNYSFSFRENITVSINAHTREVSHYVSSIKKDMRILMEKFEQQMEHNKQEKKERDKLVEQNKQEKKERDKLMEELKKERKERAKERKERDKQMRELREEREWRDTWGVARAVYELFITIRDKINEKVAQEMNMDEGNIMYCDLTKRKMKLRNGKFQNLQECKTLQEVRNIIDEKLGSNRFEAIRSSASKLRVGIAHKLDKKLKDTDKFIEYIATKVSKLQSLKSIATVEEIKNVVLIAQKIFNTTNMADILKDNFSDD